MKQTRTQAGYTLLEALVTLFIIAEILVAVLVMFDFNSRVGRSQAQIAELQQSVRVGQNSVIRLVRMAGRGGLPQGALPGLVGERQPTVPGGMAISVQSNVAVGTEIAPGFADGPLVVPGTDVITIRGVFNVPIIFLPAGESNVVVGQGADAAPAGGSFTASTAWQPIGLPVGPTSSLDQDVSALITAIDESRPEALYLVSAADPSVAGLVELDPARSSHSVNGDDVTVAVTFQVEAGGVHSAAYHQARPLPVDFQSALYVAVLEEYRLYLRQPEDGFDAELGRRSPILSMARFHPFTNTPYGDDAANLRLDIVENIYDLQVALGVDRSLNGTVEDGRLVAGLAPEEDEWLFNHEDDLPEGPPSWNQAPDPDDPLAEPIIPSLREVRISVVGLTDRPDLKYQSPRFDRVEDRVYADDDVINTDLMRQFRRRVMTTTIDLRGF